MCVIKKACRSACSSSPNVYANSMSLLVKYAISSIWVSTAVSLCSSVGLSFEDFSPYPDGVC